MKTLSIKVSDSIFAEITSDAVARNVPKSEVVRERLARKPAASRRSKGSLWSRMEDLVIKSDHLPRDLSSNKAHLTSYGKSRTH